MIAYGKGGALESVRGLGQEHPTGIFFHEQSTTALIHAVNQFEQTHELFTVENCLKQAALFSPMQFRERLESSILDQLELSRK